MAGSYRTITRTVFLVLHLLAALLFLLACLAPYADPADWWVISLLGLGFAPLAIVLILFLLFWLVFKPRYALLSIIPMLIGYKSLSVIFGFHLSDQFHYVKPAEDLRVVHWNVARFTEWKRNNNRGSQTRLKMMDQLKAQNADVLCLSEFFHSTDSTYYDNLNYVMKQLGFPHYYYSWDGDGYKQWVGQAIFSRHPIVDSGIIRYPRPGIPETLIWADLVFRNDTVRFFTTHLQSVQFKKQDYESIEKIKNRDEDLVGNSRNIFSKLKRGFILRSDQARIVRELAAQSPHPYIITGDFNDVPNSYTYSTIRSGDKLQDVFLEKGFGIGRTYSALSPTLRIDYILATRDFEVRQFHRIVKEYSDHYMLVADVRLKR